MRYAVTGSIATDHLMTFPGKFVDQIQPDQLDRLSLSFLVDELEIRRGGIGPNICFGLALFGHEPLLVGAAGDDFNADYRSWLDRHGVDTSNVHISELKHTARFLCTTDETQAQMASFYTGAMAEARFIELAPIVAKYEGGVDLVVVSPNDPVAMLRHTEEARALGIDVLADVGQQLARMDGPEIRELVDGAAFLVTNDYEKGLLETKTGWTSDEVLDRVGTRITTFGPDGCRLESRHHDPIQVEAAPERRRKDPTGVGDAFRAGFLAGRAWGLTLERSAQIGSMTATYVLEEVGTQEYRLPHDEFLVRLAQAYGDDAAADVSAHW